MWKTMLMRPNKAETAAHGCHCPCDMAVRMRKVLARSWVGVRVCNLFLLLNKSTDNPGARDENAFECVTCFYCFFF